MYKEQSLLRFKPSRYNHFIRQRDGTLLAYNSLSNALALMDETSYRRYGEVSENGIINPHDPVDQKLVQGMFILREDFNDLNFLKTRHLQAVYDSSKWGITICPTIGCNFACDYCFETKRHGRMREDVQDVMVKSLEARARRLERFSVTWYGGEPTLAWDVIVQLSKRLQEVCERYKVVYSAGMISNGYLLDQKKVQALSDLSIRMVQITLDGDAEYHDQRRVLCSGKGTFERILTNLSRFIGTNVRVAIRVNIDGRNKNGVHRLIERLEQARLGGQPNIGLYFAPVNASGGTSHAIASFCLTRQGFAELEPDWIEHAVKAGLSTIPYPSLSFGGCLAVKPEGFVIEPDGTLQKCWDTVGRPQFAVGHLLEPNGNPLNSSEYHKWMAWEPFSTGCAGCSWLPNCMGSCPLRDIHPEVFPGGAPEPLCMVFRYNSETLLSMFANATLKGRNDRREDGQVNGNSPAH